MRDRFIFVDSNAMVAEAEELVAELHLKALPVLNPDRTVFGLLAPEHQERFHSRPLNNPRAFHTWEICEAYPLLASPHTPVEELVETIREPRSTHVLVVNEDRELPGMIAAEQLPGVDPAFVPQQTFAAPVRDRNAARRPH